MVSTDHMTTGLLELIQTHYVASTVLLAAVLFVVRRFVRETYTVGGYSQKHVLITGCDSGFGNLLATQLDSKGFNVIAACLFEKGAADLAAVTSSRLKTVLLDVTSTESVKEAVEFVGKEVGERGLWGVVNNAGRSTPIGPTDWLNIEDFRKVLDVNLLGVIDVTLQTLPLLKKGQGRVVNVASILGRIPVLGGGYSPSKTGVEFFSDTLRTDMKDFGVGVSVIEPGFFKTAVTQQDLIEADLRRLWNRLPQDVKDLYGATYVEEYVKCQNFNLSFFCSPDISKVTWCMEHALTARYPRKRYSVGWDAKFFWIPLSYLPSVVRDFAITIFVPAPKVRAKH